MTLLAKIYRFAIELCRELSGESEYKRYLLSTGRRHSALEWRAFSDRRHRRKYQNAKCC